MPATLSSGLKKKPYTSFAVSGKRVLVRVDLNAPLDKVTGQVSDDARLRAHVPLIKYLVEQKAKTILIAHFGRPKGQVNPKYSLKPVVGPLSQLLGVPVKFAEDTVGEKAAEAVTDLKDGEVLLLENLRFQADEEKNNPDFAKKLASLADFFIQDAFGAVHRAHASTSALTSFLPSAAGPLLQKELTYLGGIKNSPSRPYVAVLGGAKVSDKIGVVEAFLNSVDALFIGGAMAYTFLKAQGIPVGDSLVEAESVEFCRSVLAKAIEKNVSIILPNDHVVVKNIENPAEAKVTPDARIDAGWKGVDVGPKTIEKVKPLLEKAKTVFWNGPSGIFEISAYAKGTMDIAKILSTAAKNGATVVVGGGDSVAAVTKAGVAQDMTFISTGGGASLEFLEGKELPGVKALPEA